MASRDSTLYVCVNFQSLADTIDWGSWVFGVLGYPYAINTCKSITLEY